MVVLMNFWMKPKKKERIKYFRQQYPGMLNLDGRLWVMIAILVIGLVLAIVAFSLPKKKRAPIDYYTLFVMGIIWLPVGILLKNYGLAVIGIVFMAISLANKGKWKKNHQSYSQISNKQRKIAMWISVVLGFLVLAALVLVFLARNGAI